jgi:photosynthetic reaction center H subunit
MTSPSYPFGNFDVAELVLVLFFVFFLGLVFYLRREDRREGYPLEDDLTGRLEPIGFLFLPGPKTFLLPHGHGTRSFPDGSRDKRRLAARRSAPMDGSPIEPTGDPLSDGIGPGSYVERPHYPDQTIEGHPRIVPMRLTPDIHIALKETDPRGMSVTAADGRSPGVVTDVWVDRSEQIIRYLEITLGEGAAGSAGRRVLVPMTMVEVSPARRTIKVRAIRADQFAGVPALESPEQITLYEEERVMGYFGGGYLYATPDRQEPWI